MADSKRHAEHELGDVGLDALFASERKRLREASAHGLSEDLVARVIARMTVRLAAAPDIVSSSIGGAGDGVGGGIGGAGGGIGTVQTIAGQLGASASGAAMLGRAIALKTAIVMTGAAFLVGSAVGWVAREAAIAPKSPSLVDAPMPVSAPTAAMPLMDAAAPLPASTLPPSLPPPQTHVEPVLPNHPSTEHIVDSPTASPHDRERALLSQAKRAFDRGRYRDALTSLMRHEREFAQGALGEERDMLLILAYLKSGNAALARRRIDLYRQRYPQPFFADQLQAAEAALAGR